MTRKFRILLILLLTPTASCPQRYGRPYTLADNPQLLLEIKVQSKSSYFRVSELRKMQRCVVTQTDPATKVSHVYEGVSLDQLIPNLSFASEGESIQIEFGSRHSVMTVSLRELDSQVKPIVVDKIDGKELSGRTPFSFLVKPRGKPVETISDINCITRRSFP